MKYMPKAHQRKGIKFVIQHGSAALLLEPGLGKTSIMLAAFHLLRKQKLVRRMLVIAPLRVMYSTWPAEALKWDEFHDLKIGILHGANKEAVLNDPTVDIHIINPEGLPWLFTEMEVDPVDYWEMLCVDESTRFKAHGTQRFRLIRSRLPRFRRRYILTGSPAPNGLLDLWGQVYILDLGHALGAYISHYRSNYFDPDHMGYNWKPRADSEARIYEKLAPLAIRMEAADYLEMPPLIGDCGGGSPLVRGVELPPEARRIYDQMENFLIAQLAGDTITAANAATASGKCRQIANGGMYGLDDSEAGETSVEGRQVHHLHEAKLDATEELVEELQGVPALVAYEFAHDRDRLLKRFPNAPWIGGGVTPKRFKEIEVAWNRGDIPVLLAQPQSVAHGLNLQGTRGAIIWHSLTWDLELYEQLIRRVWRQGQLDRVFVYHIIALGTIDEIIMKMLQRKDKTQKALLSALKEGYRGRR